jgi:uncharacterized protein DUF3631
MSALAQRSLDLDPPMPKQLTGGQCDNWRPLISIADACSPEVGAEARDIAVKMCHGLDEDFAVVLLSDIRDIFDERRKDKLPSDVLVADLSHGLTHDGRNGAASMTSRFRANRPGASWRYCCDRSASVRERYDWDWNLRTRTGISSIPVRGRVDALLPAAASDTTTQSGKSVGVLVSRGNKRKRPIKKAKAKVKAKAPTKRAKATCRKKRR